MSLATSVLPQLVAELHSYDREERGQALVQLAQVVDTSQPAEAIELAEYLRAVNAFADLVDFVDDPDPLMHQTALLLVGNFASDAFDSQSALTKAQLKEVGAFERIMPHVYATEWITLVYALGAVQNLCTDLDYVNVMQQAGIVSRLHELSASGDAQLGRYAAGCLANMREAILAGAAQQQWRVRRAHAAATVIQANARMISAVKLASQLREQRRHKLEKSESPEQLMIKNLMAEVAELRREVGLPVGAMQHVALDGFTPADAQNLADTTKARLMEENRQLRAEREKYWREEAETRWRREWEEERAKEDGAKQKVLDADPQTVARKRQKAEMLANMEKAKKLAEEPTSLLAMGKNKREAEARERAEQDLKEQQLREAHARVVAETQLRLSVDALAVKGGDMDLDALRAAIEQAKEARADPTEIGRAEVRLEAEEKCRKMEAKLTEEIKQKSKEAAETARLEAEVIAAKHAAEVMSQMKEQAKRDAERTEALRAELLQARAAEAAAAEEAERARTAAGDAETAALKAEVRKAQMDSDRAQRETAHAQAQLQAQRELADQTQQGIHTLEEAARRQNEAMQRQNEQMAKASEESAESQARLQSLAASLRSAVGPSATPHRQPSVQALASLMQQQAAQPGPHSQPAASSGASAQQSAAATRAASTAAQKAADAGLSPVAAAAAAAAAGSAAAKGITAEESAVAGQAAGAAADKAAKEGLSAVAATAAATAAGNAAMSGATAEQTVAAGRAAGAAAEKATNEGMSPVAAAAAADAAGAAVASGATAEQSAAAAKAASAASEEAASSAFAVTSTAGVPTVAVDAGVQPSAPIQVSADSTVGFEVSLGTPPQSVLPAVMQAPVSSAGQVPPQAAASSGPSPAARAALALGKAAAEAKAQRKVAAAQAEQVAARAEQEARHAAQLEQAAAKARDSEAALNAQRRAAEDEAARTQQAMRKAEAQKAAVLALKQEAEAEVRAAKEMAAKAAASAASVQEASAAQAAQAATAAKVAAEAVAKAQADRDAMAESKDDAAKQAAEAAVAAAMRVAKAAETERDAAAAVVIASAQEASSAQAAEAAATAKAAAAMFAAAEADRAARAEADAAAAAAARAAQAEAMDAAGKRAAEEAVTAAMRAAKTAETERNAAVAAVDEQERAREAEERASSQARAAELASDVKIDIGGEFYAPGSPTQLMFDPGSPQMMFAPPGSPPSQMMFATAQETAAQQAEMVRAIQVQIDQQVRQAQAKAEMAAKAVAEAAAAEMTERLKKDLDRTEERRKEMQKAQRELQQKLESAEQELMQQRAQATQLQARAERGRAQLSEELLLLTKEAAKEFANEAEARATGENAQALVTLREDVMRKDEMIIREAAAQREELMQQMDMFADQHEGMRTELYNTKRLREAMRNNFGSANVIIAKVKEADEWQGQMERLCLGGTGDNARKHLEALQAEQLEKMNAQEEELTHKQLASKLINLESDWREAEEHELRRRHTYNDQRHQEYIKTERAEAEIRAARMRNAKTIKAIKAASHEQMEQLQTGKQQEVRRSRSTAALRVPTLPKLSPSPSLPNLGERQTDGPVLVHASVQNTGPGRFGRNEMSWVTVAGEGDRREARGVLQTAVWQAYEGYLLSDAELKALRSHVQETSSAGRVFPMRSKSRGGKASTKESPMRVESVSGSTNDSPPGPLGLFGGSPPSRLRRGIEARSKGEIAASLRKSTDSAGEFPGEGEFDRLFPQLPDRACATPGSRASSRRWVATPMTPATRSSSPLRTRGSDAMGTSLCSSPDRASMPQSRQALTTAGSAFPPPSRSLAARPTTTSPASPPLSPRPTSTPCDGHAYHLELMRARQRSPRRAASPPRDASPTKPKSRATSPTKVSTLPVLQQGPDFLLRRGVDAWVYYDMFN